MFQWGKVGNGTKNITFPKAFKSKVFSIVGAGLYSEVIQQGDYNINPNISLTSFTIYVRCTGAYWLAIGV